MDKSTYRTASEMNMVLAAKRSPIILSTNNGSGAVVTHTLKLK